MEKTVGQSVMSKEALLDAAGLLVDYSKGSCDTIFWKKDDDSAALPVLDLVGGFGSTLLGHNHPEIISVVRQCLDSHVPVHLQGSLRKHSDALKEELTAILQDITGHEYRLMLLNTGTEAVEAALKHAEYEYARRLTIMGDSFSENIRELRKKHERNIIEFNDDFFREAEKILVQEPIEDIDSLLMAVARYNQDAFNQPCFSASFKGDFHGKTKGALVSTWNRDARLPFIRNQTNATFIEDLNEFKALVENRQTNYVSFEFSPLKLVVNKINTLSAVLYEPIQGEGGIVKLTDEQCLFLNDLKKQYKSTVFIADEIQCGLGRTGSFLESNEMKLPNDYITFAKSLGGGFSKISAIAIRAERYRDEFNLLHSSTFSDDTISSAVAKRSLEIIRRDNIAQRCEEIGIKIINALQLLKEKYPNLISEVRGKGCMIGVEIVCLADSPSAMISNLSKTKMLTMVSAGFLLHNHHIRAMPSLGNRNVIRIQPSAYFTEENLQHMITGLDSLFKTINENDSAKLISYLLSIDQSEIPARSFSHPDRKSNKENSGLRKVGFISHFIDKDSIREIDPSLNVFDEFQLEELNERIQPALEPVMSAKRIVHSKVGKSIELILYGIQMDAETIEHDISFNKSKMFKEQVKSAYNLAREDGCSLIGFGGYTSIVSANCNDYANLDIAVTSGNALTVASSMATLKGYAKKHNISIANSHVAVLGATGNIGQVHSSLLAECCGKLILVARKGGVSRLERTLTQIVNDLIGCIESNIDSHADSDGDLIIAAKSFVHSLARDHIDNKTDVVAKFLLEQELIVITDDIAICQKADIIVTATNSAQPILKPEHIATTKPVLINDIAVPKDVSDQVAAECNNVQLIRGGVVKLGQNPSFNLPGMLLEPSQVYACAGEAILLGLCGMFSNFSVGTLSTYQVKEADYLASLHGLDLNNKKTTNIF